MFIKSNIRKVTIALEKGLGQEVYLRLGRAGIIHLARLQPGAALTDAGILSEEERTRDILAGSSFVLNALQMETGESLASEKERDIDEDAGLVSRAKKTMERLQRLQTRIREKAGRVSGQLEYAGTLRLLGIDSGVIKKARLVRMVFGQVANPVPEGPADGSFILAGMGRYVFGAALPQAASRMIQFLNAYGFIDKTADIGGASLETLQAREEALRRRWEAVDRYINGFRKEMGPALLKVYHSYKGYEEVLKAMRLSAFSSKAIFITGWMDAKDKQKLVSILREICGERFIISDERDPHAPVRLMNIRLFKPFELIVKMMGMPANSEIDPTPLAAVTFVLVFGLMFGDLGQGGILAAGGWFLRRFGKKKAKDELEQAGGILIACGLFAALCGWLYGSVFSYEHLLPALWFHPTAHIMKLFGMTILMGAVFIMVGLGVNILNSILNTDYAEAFLEKRGLAVLILYVSILVFAVRYVMTGRMPAAWAIAVFAGLPLALFSLRGVLGTALFHIEKIHSLPEYVVETVMEIVEIFLGLFANTISFIRVGAFALSHAGLSIVTYTLAGMADPALKSAGAILIIVVGNIFIIGFEGLICGIQSMRLEYYEFFNKFFRGDGVVFSPFTLKAKASEV